MSMPDFDLNTNSDPSIAVRSECNCRVYFTNDGLGASVNVGGMFYYGREVYNLSRV